MMLQNDLDQNMGNAQNSSSGIVVPPNLGLLHIGTLAYGDLWLLFSCHVTGFSMQLLQRFRPLPAHLAEEGP